MFNRRHIMGMMAGGLAYGLCPKVSARVVRSDRKFIFVYAEGGWDPLAVFTPQFDSPYIDMEPGSEPLSIGDFRLVDHGNRPAVQQFFRRWTDRIAVINGISTRSVGHEVCTIVSMTGDASGSIPDWPTLLAQNARQDFSLPSLVVAGPSFPGDLEGNVARVGDNGQLARLIFEGMGTEEEAFDASPNGLQSRLDRFLLRRIDRRLPGRNDRFSNSLSTSTRRSMELKTLGDLLPFSGEGFEEQMQSAVSALSMGLSRCVTITGGGDWDTHEDNAEQAPLFQQLFSQLDALMTALAAQPGQSGGRLIDETTVVVMSEMGRTPLYNETGGRDHWPYTTAMLLGSGFAGGRQFGGYDPAFSGIGIHARSGELMTDKLGVSSMDFGATLLALADIDPQPYLPQGEILSAVLGTT